jgi:hypothetical protein
MGGFIMRHTNLFVLLSCLHGWENLNSASWLSPELFPYIQEGGVTGYSSDSSKQWQLPDTENSEIKNDKLKS